VNSILKFSVILGAISALSLTACAPPKAVLKTSSQVLNELEAHYKIGKPSGAGPYPTIIYLHGASDNAWYDHPEKITATLNSAGYATIFVDSYAGRGISGTALRSGTLLPAERAADLLISLDWAGQQSWVKTDAIGVIGYSHGATTVMDALVLAPPSRKPAGLIDTPSSGISNLKAGVLFYPWCADDIMGIELNKVFDEDWDVAVPLLGILPGADKGSDAALCSSIFSRHADKGLPVSRLDLPGVGHTFDQVNDDHGNPQPEYDPKATEKAYDATMAFFDKHLK
jgi:dienelactone hydrolase